VHTPQAYSASRARVLLATAFLATFLLALVCNLVLELLQLGGDLGFLWRYTLGRDGVLFLLNTGVVWCVVLLVLAVTGRLWLTVAISLTFATVVGYANVKKLQLRREPLYPSDWEMGRQVGFLVDMVEPGTVVAVCVLVAAVFAICIVTGRLVRGPYPRVTSRLNPRLGRGLLATRILGGLVCLAALSYAGGFNTPGNGLRAAYESHGAHWRSWYQKSNYTDNGFVAGVLYNLEMPAMARPPGYSRATMRRIAERYGSVAADLNRKRDGSLDGVNVVLLLSEAFTDPTRVRGVKFAADPIPFTRKVMETTTSGTMLAQLFGGGTANMEFEVLTGMSLSQFRPQMTTPYQMLVPNYRRFPSVVGYLEDRGHRSIAVHPFMTAMYKREQVYPIFGFDKFLGEESMRSRDRIDRGRYISDEAAFAEVRHQIAVNDDPLLVNLVTMQNHYPMADQYVDPIPVTGLTGDEQQQAAHYGRGLRHTDTALAGLLTALQDSPERTVVLFYGDHQPAFWSEQVRRAQKRLMKETPFFVWSSFGADTEPRRLPTTSPIHFVNHVLAAADAPVPPYYALLHLLEQAVPAMGRGRMVGPDDSLITYDDLDAGARRLLRDYRLVQYDLSVGKRHAQAEMFYPLEAGTTSRAAQ